MTNGKLKKDTPKIAVIGGGATGCGVARDLALRGYQVTLIEFSGLGSGTSSRFHGMLQSGARYVVSDTSYAAECYREREIIAQLVPEAVELIGGYYISLPNDPEDYPEKFIQCCKEAKIPSEEVPIEQILNKESELSKQLERAFYVPDAIINPWKLVNDLAEDIRAYGGVVLTNHQVVSIHQNNNAVSSIEVIHKGIRKKIECDGIINAAGPWSGRIAKLIDEDVKLQLTKGSVIVFSHRLVSQAINRCRIPSSNDIMCPSGTVCLWGTTSEVVDDPNTTHVRPQEIQELLLGAEELFPNIKEYRSFRAWAGVRPIVMPKHVKEGVPLPRSHAIIDHQENGIQNILTVCGGSLTTHRSMAEDVVNRIGNKFQVNEPCSSAHTKLIKDNKKNWRPSSYFSGVEEQKKFQDVICECESITKADIENLIKNEKITNFHDIRRRLRIGFGPCQGTFCTSRLAEIVTKNNNDEDFGESIISFWSERLKGSMRTAYGDQAKQMLLSDYIYQENFGLQINEENAEEDDTRS